MMMDVRRRRRRVTKERKIGIVGMRKDELVK